MMFTKISGVLLATLLVVLGLKELAHVVYHPHELEEAAYHIEVPEDLGAGAAPEEEGPVDFGVLVAAADPADGEAVARKCLACHTFEEGGATVTGPNLHDVLGRMAGSVPGFAYSDAMSDYDETWGYQNLYDFLENPRGYIQGTAMVFVGLPREEERIAMLAYLRSINPAAPALPDPLPPEPEGEEGADGEAADGDAPAEEASLDYGTLIRAADAEAGQASARICLACHTFDEGGMIITGPNLHNIVGRQAGAVPGFAYSPAMQEFGEAWDWATLDAYLQNPSEVVPGTNMVFAGLPDLDTRMNVLAYLHEVSPDGLALPEPAAE